MFDCILPKRARFFLSLNAGSDWKRLICQRASEKATLSYSRACLNQHNLLCLGVVHDPTAVERLLSLILLSLWIVFIVYVRVAVEFTGQFKLSGGLDVIRQPIVSSLQATSTIAA